MGKQFVNGVCEWTAGHKIISPVQIFSFLFNSLVCPTQYVY